MLSCKNILLNARCSSQVTGRRSLFQYLNIIFNRVSTKRIKDVGPDRACAEWLMRNGAFVKWLNHPDFVANYNSLPLDESDTTNYYIEQINATEASLTHHGFDHFRGCKHISSVKLQKCWYVNDRALEKLNFLAGSLKNLEIVACEEITDEGLHHLIALKQLQTLKLDKLTSVTNMQRSIKMLTHELPKCTIQDKGNPH